MFSLIIPVRIRYNRTIGKQERRTHNLEEGQDEKGIVSINSSIAVSLRRTGLGRHFGLYNYRPWYIRGASLMG